LQDYQPAPKASEPTVKRHDILPGQDAWAEAVRQMQRVYQHKARLSQMILHA
jgi:hypothetical protein